jgi:hypothetical protein
MSRTIQISKKHLRTARNVGIVGAVLALGGLGIHACATGPAGRQLKTYVDSIAEGLGIEKKKYRNDSIEGEINEVADKAQEYYQQNKNRMVQGRGEGIIMTYYDRLEGLEALFLEHGRPDAKQEYIERKLASATVQQELAVYAKTVPQEKAVDFAAQLYQVAEVFVVQNLDETSRNLHYLARIMYGIEHDFLSDEGKKAALIGFYDTMSPEAIAEVSASYVLQSPASRETMATSLVTTMNDDEKLAFLEKMIGALPQERYDAFVVQASERLSTDGYTAVEQKAEQKAWQARGDRVKSLIDQATQYLGR